MNTAERALVYLKQAGAEPGLNYEPTAKQKRRLRQKARREQKKDQS